MASKVRANGHGDTTVGGVRGSGFFHRRWGTITSDYEVALREHKLKTWTGTNAWEGPRGQLGDIGDVLLHETAI